MALRKVHLSLAVVLACSVGGSRATSDWIPAGEPEGVVSWTVALPIRDGAIEKVSKKHNMSDGRVKHRCSAPSSCCNNVGARVHMCVSSGWAAGRRHPPTTMHTYKKEREREDKSQCCVNAKDSLVSPSV